MIKDKGNERQTRHLSTFDDDDSEVENDGGKSAEQEIVLNDSLSPTSVTIDGGNVRPSKRPLLSTSFATTTREKYNKRTCNRQVSFENCGNKEMMVLLKALLASDQDIITAMDRSLKDIRNLTVSVETLDSKMDALFENQKKMQRALAKKKVNNN